MKRTIISGFAFMFLAVFGSVATLAQDKETYTGTILSYGSGRNTRTSTRAFTLNINGTTSDSDVDRLVSILQEDGQDALLRDIEKNDLGNISLGSQLGRTLYGVRIDEIDGKKRIRALFERWINFSEIRGGYRSLDYPFGYLELMIDPATGKGDGMLIEAGQVRWKRDKKSNKYAVEIEDYATFPAKLMGVSKRK